MTTGPPGYCNKGMPVPRVFYHSLAEVTEVPGTSTKGLHNSQKFRAGQKMLYPFPGYMWHGRTELTQVPGVSMNVVQNLQKFRVRV